MDETCYYWLTIISLLLTIIIHFRKSPISDIISCATVAITYSGGLFGSIYGNIYEANDSLAVIDALFLLTSIAIVYATWLATELFVRLFLEKFDFKGLAYSSVERLLTWITVYICIILFNLLYDNSSTPMICTVVLTAIISAKLCTGISPDLSDEDTDDYFCMVLVLLIPCFFSFWLFSSMIGDELIVNALGVRTDYHYTISVSVVPTVMLFLPVILGMASIDINEMIRKIDRKGN